jgi:glycosyltransferase involved in cell wall biosynthesis
MRVSKPCGDARDAGASDHYVSGRDADVSGHWVSDLDLAPLISVVIPCYNQAHYLGEAIESVLAQTDPHYEIIVVDDGSTDTTSEVASRYPDVRCVRQSNAGLSAARNAGLKASRGQFLVFLDADDRLLADALQSGLNCFQGDPECVFVSGHYRHINADGSARMQFPQRQLEVGPYQTLLQRNYIGMHATVMYRRQIFEIVGGFATSLQSCEDYDMYLRIVRNHSVRRHDRIVAEYRSHDASMSMDAARMLRGVMATLAAQWRYINGDPAHVRAYRTGIRINRRSVRVPLISYLRGSLQARRWPQAGRFLWTLARYLLVWLHAVWLDACLSVRLIFGKSPPADSAQPARQAVRQAKSPDS